MSLPSPAGSGRAVRPATTTAAFPFAPSPKPFPVDDAARAANGLKPPGRGNRRAVRGGAAACRDSSGGFHGRARARAPRGGCRRRRDAGPTAAADAGGRRDPSAGAAARGFDRRSDRARPGRHRGGLAPAHWAHQARCARLAGLVAHRDRDPGRRRLRRGRRAHRHRPADRRDPALPVRARGALATRQDGAAARRPELERPDAGSQRLPRPATRHEGRGARPAGGQARRVDRAAHPAARALHAGRGGERRPALRGHAAAGEQDSRPPRGLHQRHASIRAGDHDRRPRRGRGRHGLPGADRRPLPAALGPVRLLHDLHPDARPAARHRAAHVPRAARVGLEQGAVSRRSACSSSFRSSATSSAGG